MLFDFAVTVPAGVTRYDPYSQKLHLSSGVLNGIRLTFPPGCATLVSVIILNSLHQIMPANPDGSVNLDDNSAVSAGLDIKLLSPFELTFVAWSPEAIYPHTITCQFEVDVRLQDDFETFTINLMSELNNRSKGR